MPILPTEQHILTRNEMARLLKVTRNFLDHISTRGDGPPFYRIGRAIRYDKSLVEAWLAEQVQ